MCESGTPLPRAGLAHVGGGAHVRSGTLYGNDPRGDDNWTNPEPLSELLEDQGYRVICVADGEQALALIEAHPPNAVLLDVQLGADDGLSLASWTRQQPTLHHIPVIAVTPHAMVTEEQRILQAGCDSCISKPVDFKLLRDQLWLAVAADSPGAPR